MRTWRDVIGFSVIAICLMFAGAVASEYFVIKRAQANFAAQNAKAKKAALSSHELMMARP